MTRTFTTWRTVMLALLVGCLLSCNGGDEPTNQENPQDWIKKTWSLDHNGHVKHNGVDVSADYPNLSITFQSNGIYATSGAKKAFMQSGAWAWEGQGTSKVVLDGVTSLTVSELTINRLTFQFTLTEDNVNSSARSAAVLGSYQVQLIAN